MKLSIQLLFIILLLVFSFEVSAALCQKKTAIVFGNGMFNTWDEADRSRNHLRDEVNAQLQRSPSTLFNVDNTEFHLAYASDQDGYGSSTIAQLLEVLVMKLGSVDASLWLWTSGIEVAPQWFQDEMKRRALIANAAPYVIDTDFQRQLSGEPMAVAQDGRFKGYRYLLSEGKRIVIVSHSQGNFYANAVYEALTTETPAWSSSIGNVQVATPASYVASGGSHLTLNEDYVITPITTALQSTPVWGSSDNMAELGAAKWEKASLGHSFVGWYLTGTFSRNIILNDVMRVVPQLVFPTKTINNTGPITVTLWWSNATDVDLHVFEPSGTHVFYRQRQGINGVLDVDNIRGFGPEHYYVSCNAIQTGVFSIGVNYYGGRIKPEIATVVVDTEDGASYRYTTALDAPQGWRGDSSPSPVATIVVTDNLKGGLDYVVQ